MGLVEENCINELFKGEIWEALNILTDREKEILKLRFGFNSSRILTLEEIGNMYGVTRERIRQIEAKALKKLRREKKHFNKY